MNGKSGMDWDRRGAIRLAIAGAIGSMVGSRGAGAQELRAGLIAPPTQPMIYSRSVARDMVDGSQFRVTRRFGTEFRRFSDGFMIHGQQLDVAVEAPAPLVHFAELERARDESGMFPIAIDPFGQILSDEAEATGNGQIDLAVRRALEQLSSQDLASDERQTLESFAAAIGIAAQNITAHMPVDLFAPVSSPRFEEQDIALPDGARGRVTTHFSGQLDISTGLMREAAREIITEVASSRRTTSESWSLAVI